MDTRQDQTAARESAGLTWAFVIAAAAATVAMRLAPRWLGLTEKDSYFWQLMPVGALCLFAGARLRGWQAFLVPPLVMLASDLLLLRPLAQQHLPAFSWGTPLIYASFTLYAVFGRLARHTAWPWSVVFGCVLGTLQFFLVTNFLAWLGDDGTLYPKTFTGLVECYVAGLPFLRNTAAGDLLYTGLFFGLHAVLLHLPQRQKASQPV
jgi:hypothetical protein